MLAKEHSLLRMFLNIWRQILFPEDLHHASLYNFCTTGFGTFNCPRGLQLPARLSNTSVGLLNYKAHDLIVSIRQFTLSAHYETKRG